MSGCSTRRFPGGGLPCQAALPRECAALEQPDNSFLPRPRQDRELHGAFVNQHDTGASVTLSEDDAGCPIVHDLPGDARRFQKVVVADAAGLFPRFCRFGHGATTSRLSRGVPRGVTCSHEAPRVSRRARFRGRLASSVNRRSGRRGPPSASVRSRTEIGRVRRAPAAERGNRHHAEIPDAMTIHMT